MMSDATKTQGEGKAATTSVENATTTLAPSTKITLKLMPDIEAEVSTDAEGIIWLKGVIKAIAPQKTWTGKTKVLVGAANCIALGGEDFSIGDEILVFSYANNGNFLPVAYYTINTRKFYLPTEILAERTMSNIYSDKAYNAAMISIAIGLIPFARLLQSIGFAVFLLLAMAGIYFLLPKLICLYLEQKTREMIRNAFTEELNRHGIPHDVLWRR
jgi:hypothetical protein